MSRETVTMRMEAAVTIFIRSNSKHSRGSKLINDFLRFCKGENIIPLHVKANAYNHYYATYDSETAKRVEEWLAKQGVGVGG